MFSTARGWNYFCSRSRNVDFLREHAEYRNVRQIFDTIEGIRNRATFFSKFYWTSVKGLKKHPVYQSSCLNDRSISVSSSSTAGAKFRSSNSDRARNFLLLRCWIPVKTGWKFDKIEIYTDEARFGLRQVSLISERSADYSQDTALTGATCWFNRASQVTRATLRASGTTWRASSDLLSRVSV